MFLSLLTMHLFTSPRVKFTSIAIPLNESPFCKSRRWESPEASVFQLSFIKNDLILATACVASSGARNGRKKLEPFIIAMVLKIPPKRLSRTAEYVSVSDEASERKKPHVQRLFRCCCEQGLALDDGHRESQSTRDGKWSQRTWFV